MIKFSLKLKKSEMISVLKLGTISNKTLMASDRQDGLITAQNALIRRKTYYFAN